MRASAHNADALIFLFYGLVLLFKIYNQWCDFLLRRTNFLFSIDISERMCYNRIATECKSMNIYPIIL